MVASESSGPGLLFLLCFSSCGKVRMRIICLTTLLALLFTTVSFASDLPLLVGGHDHGAVNIQALHDLGVGNFIWIPKHNVPEDGNTPWDEEHDIFAAVDACVKNKMYFMISQGRGLGFHVRPGGPEYGGDGNGLMHPDSTITEIVKRSGELFAGLHAEELDADLVQSALRPSYRSRIPELYDFTDRAGGRRCFETELLKLKRHYKGYAPSVKFWPNLCITYHHCGFRIGADLVIAELLEHLPTTELQLAYLRGGARQFGGDWGVWVSPWYAGQIPCEDKKLWPASYAVPGGGHSASSFRRCLYLAYVSGARVLTSQCVEPLLSYKDPSDPSKGYKLAAWGQELKNFWDYAKNHQERMDPIIPFALLVDKDNGWAPGHLWGDWIEHESVWGKLSTDRADKMLSRYLDVLLPGYGRDKDCWKNKTIYPGYFASTPSGPFDIVSSDISAERLSHYRAVVVMADVDMTRELLNTLRSYVSAGGTLYVNVDQMRHHEDFVQDAEFLGATIGMSSFYVGWVGGHVPGRKVISGNKIVRKLPIDGIEQKEFSEPWFVTQDVQVKTAEVVADDGNGNPVLLRNRFGKGAVYLSTPEYMMEGYNDFSRTLNFFKAVLLTLGRTSPVTVTAPDSDLPTSDISWVASRQANSVVICIANHSKNTSKAEIAWRAPFVECKVEVGSAKAERKNGLDNARWEITVPGEDIVVVRITIPD